MKNRGITVACVMIFMTACAVDVKAAGIYINQTFESIPLNSLPSGWATRTKTTSAYTGVKVDPFSALQLGTLNPTCNDPNHGNVLTIVDSLATGQTNGYEQLEIPFPSSIVGEDIRIAFDWILHGYQPFVGNYQLWGVAVYDSLSGDLPPSTSDQNVWELTSQELCYLRAETLTDPYGSTVGQGTHHVAGSPLNANKQFAQMENIDPCSAPPRVNVKQWNTTIYTLHWNAATSQYSSFDVEVWYRGSGQYFKASSTKSPGLGSSLAKMRIWAADASGSHVNTAQKLSIDNVWVASASIPRFNGEYGVNSKGGDINQDAVVNMKDVMLFAQKWLACSDPKNAACSHWWDSFNQ
jgi:hypothetical protein